MLGYYRLNWRRMLLMDERTFLSQFVPSSIKLLLLDLIVPLTLQLTQSTHLVNLFEML